jgi:hypothetical protein
VEVTYSDYRKVDGLVYRGQLNYGQPAILWASLTLALLTIPVVIVFYLLNLLAFLAHKLLEFGDRLYQQCCTGESRRGLWTLFRSAFYLLEFETWDALLRYHLRETVAGP